MAVFIFPRPKLPAPEGVLESLAALGVRLKHGDPTYCEGARKVFRVEADGRYVETAQDSMIIVDPSLPFKPEDIAPYWLFGNGLTYGTVTLKDGRVFDVAFFVVDHADAERIRGMLNAVRRALGL
jgi:hypothetical protein